MLTIVPSTTWSRGPFGLETMHWSKKHFVRSFNGKEWKRKKEKTHCLFSCVLFPFFVLFLKFLLPFLAQIFPVSTILETNKLQQLQLLFDDGDLCVKMWRNVNISIFVPFSIFLKLIRSFTQALIRIIALIHRRRENYPPKKSAQQDWLQRREIIQTTQVSTEQK